LSCNQPPNHRSENFLTTNMAHLASKLRIPVIGAPLFIISNPDLVIAQCKAGIVGSFPALNARPKDKLDEWCEIAILSRGSSPAISYPLQISTSPTSELSRN
jgi:hypothetical protein